MTEERIVRLRTHSNNVDRYRQLLKTNLSEIERQYLEKRLSEEQAAMEMNLERGSAVADYGGVEMTARLPSSASDHQV